MKCFERLLKDHIPSRLSSTFHTCQFGYRSNLSTNDVIFYFLPLKQTYAYAVTGHQLHAKYHHPTASNEQICPFSNSTYLCDWLPNFLPKRPQRVQVGKNVSSAIFLTAGVPKGCVHYCFAKFNTCQILKVTGVTTKAGLISNNDDKAYREKMIHLVWDQQPGPECLKN